VVKVRRRDNTRSNRRWPSMPAPTLTCPLLPAPMPRCGTCRPRRVRSWWHWRQSPSSTCALDYTLFTFGTTRDRPDFEPDVATNRG